MTSHSANFAGHPMAVWATWFGGGLLVSALLSLLLGLVLHRWRRRAPHLALSLTLLGAATWWLVPRAGTERIVVTTLVLVCAAAVVLPGRSGRSLEGLPGVTLTLAILVLYMAALLILNEGSSAQHAGASMLAHPPRVVTSGPA